MPQPYIDFDCGIHGIRKMTVIDGLPFYQSRGQSSLHANVWFPFIMMHGSDELNFDFLPSWINKSALASYFKEFDYCYYIVKLDSDLIIPEPKKIFKCDDLSHRLPCMSQLLVHSIRLTGRKSFPELEVAEASLTQIQRHQAGIPIQLNDKPEFTFSSHPDDIDKLNQWLIEQGAILIKSLLPMRSDSAATMDKHSLGLFTPAAKNTGEEEEQRDIGKPILVAGKKVKGVPLLTGVVSGVIVVSGIPLYEGIAGLIGKSAYSFFNPVVASTLGGFCSFARIGVLGLAIVAIPQIITKYYLHSNSVLNQYPKLKDYVYRCLTMAWGAIGNAAAAALVGSPILPSMICLMAVPTALHVVSTLYEVIKVISSAKTDKADSELAFN